MPNHSARSFRRFGGHVWVPNFLMDLHDDPGAIKKAAGQGTRLLLQALEMHYSKVKPKLGGYGHKYGYWAPRRTQVIQEDAMGLRSPAMYRDIFMEYNAEVLKHLGCTCSSICTPQGLSITRMY